MKHAAGLAVLIGIASFTAVLIWQGAGDMARALAAAGWGLGVVTAWHGVPLAIDSFAWWLLFSRPRPGFKRIVWSRWIGESINQLLPVAQVGGDVAKARLLTLTGLPGPETGATVVVDTTLAAAAQMLFGLVGGLLLVALLDQAELAASLGLAVVLMVFTLGFFYRLQRGGLFTRALAFIRRISGRLVRAERIGDAHALDRTISRIYSAPALVARATFWRLAGWLAGIGEVWLALSFLNVSFTLTDALMLEALGQAIRGAAFFIPGALGVQEGGFVLLASLLGLGPEPGLALSLIKRVRELVLGVPGLVAWQWSEGRALRSKSVEGS